MKNIVFNTKTLLFIIIIALHLYSAKRVDFKIPGEHFFEETWITQLL